MSTPLFSYIVLSYNYENYIGTTLRSILAQTVQDFEVIVVDDASSDRSCEVVRSFDDPRIHLVRNVRNLGGAGSYNVAVDAARGEWLVNVDADDWIAPDKSERQIAAARQDPRADIIGTWVNAVDSDGRSHPDASDVESLINVDYDLNLLDHWIGINHVCRSSTMVRRDAHLRIGLDDIGMSAAPDYELWTRALAAGCRFHVMKDRLTFMRRHGRGVTFADPLRTFLEVCFVFGKNLLPLAEGRALWPSYLALLQWAGTHSHLPNLGARERERLFGLFATRASPRNFAAFRATLSRPDPALESIGRPALVMAEHLKTRDDWWWLIVQREARAYRKQAETMEAQTEWVALLTAARDHFKGQSESWEAEARQLMQISEGRAEWIALLTEARDYFKGQRESWEAEARRLVQLCDSQAAHIAWLSSQLPSP